MVQVLPAVQGFGSQLGQTLAGAVGNIGQGLLQKRDKTLDSQILQQLTSNPNASPMDQIKAFSSLSKGSQETLGPVFSEFLKNQEKQQSAKAEVHKEHEDVSQTINDLTDELMKGKTGLFNKINTITSKGRESRAYFDELALGIEKRLASMVGKGALNKERFNYLKKNLPSSSDTDATNRGKLKALAKEFHVELKNPEFKKSIEETRGSTRSASAGTTSVISPSGKSVSIPNDQVEAALASGGKLA